MNGQSVKNLLSLYTVKRYLTNVVRAQYNISDGSQAGTTKFLSNSTIGSTF